MVRLEYQLSPELVSPQERTAAVRGARVWLVSSQVAAWLANVAADIPDHALADLVHVTVEWR